MARTSSVAGRRCRGVRQDRLAGPRVYLMPNHFDWVVATPHASRMAGMKWFPGTDTGWCNRRHRLCGHFFSCRSKALEEDETTPGYLKPVCDNVPLNPVRARLLRV